MNHPIQPLSIETLPNTTFKKPQAKPYQQIQVQGKKSFQCLAPGCEKIFKFKSDMERHALVHTKEKPIICSYPNCNKSFKRPEALRNHVETMHIVNKTFVCPIPDCGYQIHKEDSLDFHLGKHWFIQKCAQSSPDDGKMYVPWKRSKDWEKRFYAKYKAEFIKQKKNHFELAESGLEGLKKDWDILSCLEEGDEGSDTSEKFFEQLEFWKNKDVSSFSRDSSDTLSLRSFRDESPSLISGARDLLRSVCKQMAQAQQSEPNKEIEAQERNESDNSLKPSSSEALGFGLALGTQDKNNTL